MKQFSTLILLVLSVLLKGQNTGQYLRVVNSLNAALPNAVAFNKEQSVQLHANALGWIYIEELENSPIVISAPGYKPTAFSSTQLDSVQLKLIPLKAIVKNEESQWRGLQKMRPVFIEAYKNTHEFNATVIEQNHLQLHRVPIEINGISGRVIPSIKDSGTVYSGLRVSKYYSGKNNNSYEYLSAICDTGLFKGASNLGLKELVYNPFKEALFFNPLSELQFKTPFSDNGKLHYNFYLQDSITLHQEEYYYIYFEPIQNNSPYFSGYTLLNKKNNVLSEVHLKLFHKNQIQYLDSLQLSFYNPSTKNNVFGLQRHNYRFNVLGYQFSLDVKNILAQIQSNNISNSIRTNKFQVFEGNYQLPLDSIKSLFKLTNGGQNLFQDSTLSSSLTSAKHRRLLQKTTPINAIKSFLFVGNDYNFGPGYLALRPLILSIGFNTVEGGYINYKTDYRINGGKYRLLITPNLRYGFATKTFYPKIETTVKFNYENPVTFVFETGKTVQQFNALSPISPGVNTFYSLLLQQNFMKLYQKSYVKFLFDKELMRGLELVFSFEVAKRTALFNNSNFTLFGTGAGFTPNNLDFSPVISSKTGFQTHQANILHFQLYYQLGRKYVYRNNQLKKVKSTLPRFRCEYRKAISYSKNMPDYDLLVIGVGTKNRIKQFGFFESDFTFGSFINNYLVQFADYKHFNGIQTAFINKPWDGWTDVRHFSTLPYYAYSTNQSFAEIHLKHQFQGWLMSKFKKMQRLNLHAYAGYNFLYTQNIGAYNEWYVGLQNVLKVINVQLALGVNQSGDFRGGLLLGFNFDYTFYLNSKNGKYY